MSDTSRELVIKAIEFREPERIPLCLHFARDPRNSEYTQNIRRDFTSDILIVSGEDPGFVPRMPDYTQWGYRWETLADTMGEVKDVPLPDWEAYPEWKAALPDFSEPRRFEAAAALRKENPDKFLVGGLGMGMEEIINLRGFAEYMIDFYENPDQLEALIDLLYEKMYQLAAGFAKAGMDGIILWEDWGLQDRALVSPVLWHQFFAEKMKAFIAYVHSLGMKYILHSCGYILDLLDDFVAMGVDVIQQDQQQNMGFEQLSRWKGKICFLNPVDIQLSPKMDKDALNCYARDMWKALGGPGGGFIYKVYPQPVAIHISEENIINEIEAFKSIQY